MREIRTSGSVGGPGEATARAHPANVVSRPPNVGDGRKAFFIAHLTAREDTSF
jgi:hypothetical protein